MAELLETRLVCILWSNRQCKGYQEKLSKYSPQLISKTKTKSKNSKEEVLLIIYILVESKEGFYGKYQCLFV